MKFFFLVFTLFAQSLLADNMKELSFVYDGIDRNYLLNFPDKYFLPFSPPNWSGNPSE